MAEEQPAAPPAAPAPESAPTTIDAVMVKSINDMVAKNVPWYLQKMVTPHVTAIVTQLEADVKAAGWEIVQRRVAGH